MLGAWVIILFDFFNFSHLLEPLRVLKLMVISKQPFTMDVEWEKPKQAKGNVTGYRVTCLEKGEESSKPKIAGKLLYSPVNAWQGLY